MTETQGRGYAVIVLAGQGRLPNEEQIIRPIVRQGFPVEVVRSVDELLEALVRRQSEHPIIIAEFDTISDGHAPQPAQTAEGICSQFVRRVFTVRETGTFEVVYVGDRARMRRGEDVLRGGWLYIMDCYMCFPVDPAELARMVSSIRRYVKDERGYDVRM